jgi:oligoendopeptidase F
MHENKRYLAKYSDLRSFAYGQIENLVKKNEQQAKGRRSLLNTTGPVGASSINIYKNLIEKERKQWQDERQRKEEFISNIQSKVLQMSNQMEHM